MTYKELIEKFELFANSHVDISRFKCDTLDRMDNFSNESERFPLFYIAPINSVQNFYNTNYKSISYSFRAFFLVPRIDLENTKLDNNINLNQTTTNLNQCEMIMRHFTLFLDNNFDKDRKSVV